VEQYQGVAPPGMEPVIKKMKQKTGKDKVKNPWALAWWMKKNRAQTELSSAGLPDSEAELDALTAAYADLERTGQVPDACVKAAQGEAWAQALLLGSTPIWPSR
jgi:hypothetical protein